MTQENLNHLNDLSNRISSLKKHYKSVEEKANMTHEYTFLFDPGSNESRVELKRAFLPMPKQLFFTMYLASVMAKIEELENEFQNFKG